jgi:hypothetical protein
MGSLGVRGVEWVDLGWLRRVPYIFHDLIQIFDISTRFYCMPPTPNGRCDHVMTCKRPSERSVFRCASQL